MRRRITIAAAALSVVALIAAAGYMGLTTNNPAVGTASAKTTLAVSGMTCTGCEYAIETTLRRVEGVHSATADFRGASAVVTYDPALVHVDALVKAVAKVGYRAKTLSTTSLKEVKSES